MAKRVTGATTSSTSNNTSSSQQIFSARVIYCILDDKTNKKAFESQGEWSSIGGILFEKVKTGGGVQGDVNQNPFAKPLFPNLKNYPLKNEIVYIIALSSSDVETNAVNTSFYYFQPINLWNSIHHNAVPNGIDSSTLPPSQRRDYTQTEAGAVRRVTDGGTDIDLGETFKEKLDIKSLQPFEGDVIHEGRWGQSVRFGSTVKGGKIDNPWSDGFGSKNGDPITIIRNGQHEDENDPWVPQVEDINKDLSSVYITSTQKIPIEVSSENYDSYKRGEKPQKTDKFNEEQIILNSGRLLFNSKTDSILFSSKDSINLNSVNSVNIDSPKTVVQSEEILLGDKRAKEPVILGDSFLKDLEKLLTEVAALGNILGAFPIMIAPFTPSSAHIKSSTTMAFRAQQMITAIDTYKSKVTKSK